MKGKSIVYWTMTILVAFPIGSGGVSQVAQYLGNPHGVVPVLGYPTYFFAILGFWKVLGAIAILVPRFPRLKVRPRPVLQWAGTALTGFTSSRR
jgi:hypothetical protein